MWSKQGRGKKYRITIIYLKANGRIWSMENSRLPFCSDCGTLAASNTSCDSQLLAVQRMCALPSLDVYFMTKIQKSFVILAEQKQTWKHQQQVLMKRNSCFLPSPNHKLEINVYQLKAKSFSFLPTDYRHYCVERTTQVLSPLCTAFVELLAYKDSELAIHCF